METEQSRRSRPELKGTAYENDAPRAEVIISDTPTRTQSLADRDLQSYLENITGAGLRYGAYRIVSGDDWMVFIGDDECDLGVRMRATQSGRSPIDLRSNSAPRILPVERTPSCSLPAGNSMRPICSRW